MYDFSLDYATSVFNPALKMISIIFYILIAYAFFRSRKGYAGKLKTILNILVWMALVGAIASLFRYLGHGTMFGFTKEYSLKWFQSLCYVIQASLLAYASKRFFDAAVVKHKQMTQA